MHSIRHFGPSLAVLLISAGLASAQVITSNPGLPPDTGVYESPQDVHADYNGPGLAIVLSQLQHQPFANTVFRSADISTLEEFEQFNSQATGEVSINGSPDAPFVLTGPVTVGAFDKADSVTGTFNTQMISMDLTGNVGGNSVEIMLDPNNTTTGQTTITDVGGGLYQITSFFDVFTELSLNGGPFIPQSNGPTLVELVPEPTSIALLGGGALFLLRRHRRAAAV